MSARVTLSPCQQALFKRFPSKPKRKASVFKSSRLKSVFEKLFFLIPISMDRRPNWRKNNSVFQFLRPSGRVDMEKPKD